MVPAITKKTSLRGRFFFVDVSLINAAVFLFLSWLSPFHFVPWVSWHSEALLFFATFFFPLTIIFPLVVKDNSRLISVPVLILPFIALTVLAVGQVATGRITFGGDALVILLYIALCIVCLTSGHSSVLNTKGANETGVIKNSFVLNLIAASVLLGGIVSAIVEFAQVFEIWEQSSWINRMPQLRRPGGNLGQPNQLATLFSMGIASLLFLYESGKLKAASGLLIYIVLCTALAMTESRTGVLSLILLTGWYLSRSRQARFKIPHWGVVGACVTALTFFWIWPSIFNFILQTTGVDNAVVNVNPGYRLIVWPQLLEAVAQRPWLGWGLNQVPKAHNAVASSYLLSEPYSYSHNILIDLALGLGLPLALLLVLVTGVWLWRRVRRATQLLPWYCVAVVLPVAVHSMFEFPFTYAYFLVPVMLVLGVLEGLSGGKSALKIGIRPAAAFLLAISAVAAWSVVEYVEIEEDFRVARFEALRVGQTPLNYERPRIVLLTQLDALLEGARIIPRPGMSLGELDLAKNVALRYPWVATQNRYALSLALNGSLDEALRQLRVMRALHGEKEFTKIRENWRALGREKYPELRVLGLP